MPRSDNRILSSLSHGDAAMVAPLLEAVELPHRRQLERRGRRFEYAYFIDSGVASIVADATSMRSIEVGMIGSEGVIGVGGAMGATHSPYDTFMQVTGAGRRMPAADFQNAMNESATFRTSILQFAYAFSVQIAQTALSNARSKIEDRLARWLLMVHDRIDGDEMLLTHDYLATMLGVRRAGVSVAMKALERQGLVQIKRGAILILNREGLERNSNGAYGETERSLTKFER